MSPVDVSGPLVDHHCHGVVRGDLDRVGVEELLNEATHRSPLGTTLFDSMVGLAVRRWCAPVLDLEPLVDAETYVRRRSELTPAELARRFVGGAGLSDVVVDTGFGADRLTPPDDLAAYAGARAHEIIRLETTLESVLADGTAFDDVDGALRQRLRESGAVGAKSIAAYRSGLALPQMIPPSGDVVDALSRLTRGPDGRYRVADPLLNGWLAWVAVEERLPLQIHVGYGDNDVDLDRCDPLLMTGFLRASQERLVPTMLLHNWPFHRQAAYLAQVFDQVFVDVGLTVHNTGALSTPVLRELVEMAPFGKILFSSDAFGLPEHYLLGALLFRRSLGTVLDDLVAAGEMGPDDAQYVVGLVSQDNARRAYRLDSVAGH